MKIQDFSLPLKHPLQTARIPITTRDGFLIKIRNTHTGIGEATPLPDWTESLDTCRTTLTTYQEQSRQTTDQPNFELLSDTPAARHGIALAIADLEAKQADQPLYQALGRQATVDSIPVNATIGDATVEETVTQAIEAVNDGYSCLKIKVGAQSLTTDAARLTAVRDAVGPEITIRADANGAWSRSTARDAINRFSEADIAYLEQPLPASDLDGLAALQGGATQIAIDETLCIHPLADILQRNVADIMIIKPMVLGGVDQARQAAQRIRTTGRDVIFTTTIDGVVARTAAAHLAASLPTSRPHGLATAEYLTTDLATDPAPITAGRMQIPQTPGHGVTGAME